MDWLFDPSRGFSWRPSHIHPLRKALSGVETSAINRYVNHRSFWLQVISGLYASLVHRHQGIFSLVKGTLYASLNIMHDAIILTQNEAMGARSPSLAVAAPIASFWISIVTNLMQICRKAFIWGNCKILLDQFKGTMTMARVMEAIAFVAWKLQQLVLSVFIFSLLTLLKLLIIHYQDSWRRKWWLRFVYSF